MKKIALLAVCAAPSATTGFENVTDNCGAIATSPSGSLRSMVSGPVATAGAAKTAAATAYKQAGITALFTQLAQQNIEVLSLRNKTNRLEELFVSLVEKNLSKVAV